MNKIVQAVNAMILKSSKISQVTPSIDNNEIFFLYDKKYKWSMSYNEENKNYYLMYYTTDLSIGKLASIVDWPNYQNIYIAYNTNDIKTQEARESFAELYSIVKNKIFGMDSVLDDIIGDDL